mmetsp:Transcript_81775/g.264996  ORF Transcript_81775/g.264996 Transcript_81775/m.264996 type:complete len:218 (-) Transcript_81775:118-771(-)
MHYVNRPGLHLQLPQQARGRDTPDLKRRQEVGKVMLHADLAPGAAEAGVEEAVLQGFVLVPGLIRRVETCVLKVRLAHGHFRDNRTAVGTQANDGLPQRCLQEGKRLNEHHVGLGDQLPVEADKVLVLPQNIGTDEEDSGRTAGVGVLGKQAGGHRLPPLENAWELRSEQLVAVWRRAREEVPHEGREGRAAFACVADPVLHVRQDVVHGACRRARA